MKVTVGGQVALLQELCVFPPQTEGKGSVKGPFSGESTLWSLMIQ